MSHKFPAAESLDDELTHELLTDLEELNQIGIRLTRDTASLSIKAPVEVRAGDVCARRTVLVRGTTRELQRRGVSCVLAEPVITGSVFYLVFDRAVLDLDSELAICDRSIMLSNTAFDTHFRFVRDIDFPGDGNDR